MNYIIDELTEGLEPSLTCSYPCKTCSNSDRTFCKSCYLEGDFDYLQGSTGKCQTKCDSEYTTNGSEDKICEDCDESCNSCIDKGQVEDKFRCTTCASTFDMTYRADKRCF
jgi:hypothetical protein